jgi:hypothetical protein
LKVRKYVRFAVRPPLLIREKSHVILWLFIYGSSSLPLLLPGGGHFDESLCCS